MVPTIRQRSSVRRTARLRWRYTAPLFVALLSSVLAACEASQVTPPEFKWGVPRSCKDAAKLHLADLRIPAAAVREITLRTDATSGRGSSRVSGHQAWVRLNSCKGHVILNMYRECGLQTAYTTQDCRVPGLPAR